jgi:hypothetical protein
MFWKNAVKKGLLLLCIRGAALAASLVCLASCGYNVLSSGHPGLSPYITPVYTRKTYYVYTAFNKQAELSVMAVHPNGLTEIAPIERVAVFYDGTRIDNIAFVFNAPGSYTLNITYAGMSASYTVTVLDPSAAPGPGSDTPAVNDPEDGFGILIIGP